MTGRKISLRATCMSAVTPVSTWAQRICRRPSASFGRSACCAAKAPSARRVSALRHEAREQLTAAAGVATAMAFDFDYENVIVTKAHRDRLDVAITEMARDRLLVEAARHHRARYDVGAVMRSRWGQAPAPARARRRREPAAVRPLGEVHRASQTTHHCQRHAQSTRIDYIWCIDRRGSMIGVTS